ncbi:MAG TPA: CapA family protein [Thermoanaerobaculia bacterium]|nr:CapA family protein [Thermoanaerobaculia bacterium]
MIAAPPKDPAEIRFLFTGDIMLSRLVQFEVQKRKVWPWSNEIVELLRKADWVGGNFEGAIGADSQCVSRPCFATPSSAVAALKDGRFKAVTIENNHAGDLGAAGRDATRTAFQQAGLLALDFDASPQFLRFGDVTVAIVAITLVRAADGRVQEIPSIAVAQKLRLARQLANIVVVSIHWGSELVDWPTDTQRADASWLVDHGADVILGHHPHVVQRPECIRGRPVFFSLGNHVFDQKYPETKDGLIADCRIRGGRLQCGAIHTHTDPGTSFPQLGPEDEKARVDLASCTAGLAPDLVVGGFAIRPEPWSPDQPQEGLILDGTRDNRVAWRSRRQRVVSLEVAKLEGPDKPPLLLTIERHASPLDHEEGLRPYVYAIGSRGLIAKWRGSALAWPLLDAVAEPDGTICALHRADSFAAPDPENRGTRTAAYRWNGFGFDGVGSAEAANRCAAVLSQGAGQEQ